MLCVGHGDPAKDADECRAAIDAEMANAAYAVFAKFVVKNPAAGVDDVLLHVAQATNGGLDPDLIRTWYAHWRVLWTELAL